MCFFVVSTIFFFFVEELRGWVCPYIEDEALLGLIRIVALSNLIMLPRNRYQGNLFGTLAYFSLTTRLFSISKHLFPSETIWTRQMNRIFTNVNTAITSHRERIRSIN